MPVPLPVAPVAPQVQPSIARTRAAAAARFAAWSAATAGCWIATHGDYPRASAALSAPAVMSLVALLGPDAWRNRAPLRAFGLAVGMAAAAYVLSETGGIRSPLTALFMVLVMEGAGSFGPTGGVVAATVCAGLSGIAIGPGATIPDLALHGAFAAALILSAILIAAYWPEPYRPTLMEPRNTEDLERRLAEAEDARRILQANYREAAAIARTARTRQQDAELALEMVTACATDDLAGTGLKRAFDRMAAGVEAGSAAMWRMSEGGRELAVIATHGRVAPLISAEPISVPDGAEPSAMRRVCQMRLQAASPALPEGADADAAVMGSVLRDGDRIVGAVAVTARAGAAFGEDDRARLVALAAHMARGIALSGHQAALLRAQRDAAELRAFGRAAAAATSLQHVCAAAAETAARLIPCENCTVFALDPRRGVLAPQATRGEMIDLADHVRCEGGAGIAAWIAHERRQLVIADLAREASMRAGEKLPPRVRSFAAAPAPAPDGSAVGAIAVSDAQPGVLTPEHVHSLTALAGELAAVLRERNTPNRT